MALCVVSSPTIEQLHCSGPTGIISWIIKPRRWPFVGKRAVVAKDQGSTANDYFCGAAGFTGCDLAGDPLTPCSTEFVPLCREA